jgi:hypothetical protein
MASERESQSGEGLLTLLAAVVVAFLVVAALTAIVNALKMQSTFVDELAKAPLLFVERIQKALAKSIKRPELAPPANRLVSIEGYRIPWPNIVIYGAAILAGSIELVAFLGSSLASLFGVDRDGSIITGLIVALYGGALVAFFLGRRIGMRCPNWHWAAVIATVVLARILGAVADYLFVPAQLFEEVTGVPKSVDFVLRAQVGLLSLAMLSSFILAGMIGLLRSGKAQFNGYIGYLLSLVDRDTRDSIVALAYEEASKPLSTRPIGSHPRPLSHNTPAEM